MGGHRQARLSVNVELTSLFTKMLAVLSRSQEREKLPVSASLSSGLEGKRCRRSSRLAQFLFGL
jgi:hypothetical protein